MEYNLVIKKIEIKKPKLLTFGTDPPSNKDGTTLNKKQNKKKTKKKSHKKILENEIKKNIYNKKI